MTSDPVPPPDLQVTISETGSEPVSDLSALSHSSSSSSLATLHSVRSVAGTAQRRIQGGAQAGQRRGGFREGSVLICLFNVLR